MKNVHDKFVKEQLLDKKNAIDFLRVSLPREVLKYLDLNYLEPTQNFFYLARILKNCFQISSTNASLRAEARYFVTYL